MAKDLQQWPSANTGTKNNKWKKRRVFRGIAFYLLLSFLLKFLGNIARKILHLQDNQLFPSCYTYWDVSNKASLSLFADLDILPMGQTTNDVAGDQPKHKKKKKARMSWKKKKEYIT